MEEQKVLPYPYEFKHLEPEQQAEIDELYDAMTPINCLRVGPKGYLVFEPFKKDAANIYNMPLRSTDIFVVTYQRSGTTWAQELVWLVSNDLDYAKAAAIPLTHRYPFLDGFMYFDEKYMDKYIKLIRENECKSSEEQLREIVKMLSTPASGIAATMPSPRFIKSHLPLSLLNPKLLDTAKVVYIARDPRDVAVSCFHHARLFQIMRFPGGFKEFWYMFHKNLFTLLPYFDHVKEAWNQRHHPNMLFLFYEDLSKVINGFMYFDEKYMDKYIKLIRENECKSSEEQLREIVKMLSTPASGIAATMPSPRFIKSHLPLSLLNPKLLDTAKVVYIARDPRDVAVSCFHHARLFQIMRFPGGFKEFWYMFHKNLFTLLPYFDHVKEAWNQRHHPNMLFLFYEDLSKDLPAAIKRVADFLGKELTEEQIDGLCDHLSIEKFKNNMSVNFEEIREHGMLAKNETFIRKGKTGGWRDYFDYEMTLQAERWIRNNLKDTDLRFPHMEPID